MLAIASAWIWGIMNGLLRDGVTSIRDSLWLVPVFAWVVLSSSLVVLMDPFTGLAVGLAPIALYLLVRFSWIRVAIVVGGGMYVLGSTSDVGPLKILYAGALVLCAAISIARLIRNPISWAGPFKPLIALGLILLACLMLGTIATRGQDVMTVVRQSLPYVMIPLAPFIGLDAGRDVKPANALRWIGLLGCVSAAGSAADWLDRRGVSSLGFGRIISGSIFIAALAFALALVMVFYSRGWSRFFWLLPIMIIPVPLLVTGTRTNLIVFLALIGIVGSSAKLRVPLHKALLIAVVAVGSLAVLLPAVAPLVISQPGFLENRIQALMNVVNGDASDQSYDQRNEQYYYAAQWINESPWFGKGPGFSTSISLDTPLATVVKLGYIGTGCLIGLLLAMVAAIRKVGKLHGFTVMHTAVTGVVLVFLADLPFGSPAEDRGFSFMIILAFMGIAALVQARTSGAPYPIEVKKPQNKPKPNLSPAYARLASRAESDRT